MKSRIYSRHGSSHLGERGKRKIKKVPLTGPALEALRQKNIAEENNDFLCISCGTEVKHNYGTDEYPQCILCGNNQ
jgi:hypothetical protein